MVNTNKMPLPVRLAPLTDGQISDLGGWWQCHLSDVLAQAIAAAWHSEAARQGQVFWLAPEAARSGQGLAQAVLATLADLLGMGDRKVKRDLGIKTRFITPKLAGITARQVNELGAWWAVGRSDSVAIAVALAWLSEAKRQGYPVEVTDTEAIKASFGLRGGEAVGGQNESKDS